MNRSKLLVGVFSFLACVALVTAATPYDDIPGENGPAYKIKGTKCVDANKKPCTDCTGVIVKDSSCSTGNKCYVSACDGGGNIPQKTCVLATANDFCDTSNSATAAGCGTCTADACGCTSGANPETCTIDATNCPGAFPGGICSPTGLVTTIKWRICKAIEQRSINEKYTDERIAHRRTYHHHRIAEPSHS